jgi:Flp pilus assembly protein TadD
MGEVRYQLGALAHILNALPDARAHLAEAVRLDGHHPEYQNEYATVLYRLGELEEAAAHFREAEELAPDNPIIKANLGFCYMQMGEREAAAAYFEAFLARPAANETIRMSVQCALDLL